MCCSSDCTCRSCWDPWGRFSWRRSRSRSSSSLTRQHFKDKSLIFQFFFYTRVFEKYYPVPFFGSILIVFLLIEMRENQMILHWSETQLCFVYHDISYHNQSSWTFLIPRTGQYFPNILYMRGFPSIFPVLLIKISTSKRYPIKHPRKDNQKFLD